MCGTKVGGYCYQSFKSCFDVAHCDWNFADERKSARAFYFGQKFVPIFLKKESNHMVFFFGCFTFPPQTCFIANSL